MLLNDPTNRFRVWAWDDDSEKQAMRLRAQGYSHARIAELMGIPSEGVVKKRLEKLARLEGKPILAGHNRPFTDEEREQFKTLFATGMSMLDIAVKMGRTKNAICGLRMRMNLPKRVGLAKAGEPNPYTSQIKKKHPIRPDGRPRAPKIVKDPAELIAAQKRLAEAADVGFHNGGLTFAQLTPTCCRFIKGEVQDPEHRYCGSKVVDGKSWCRHHLGVVFRGS